MRHLPNLLVLSTEEVNEILQKAHEIKRSPQDYRSLLAFESLAMVFQKTSTRTRVSFEVAMTELGGHALYLDWMTTNLSISDPGYEIEYLSRNVSCILARMKLHSDFQKIQNASRVPVINGCCERSHPCQALTDVMTMQENSDKPIDEIRVNYIGVMNNVSSSLVEMASLLGFHLTLTTPAFPPDGVGDVQDLILSSDRIRHTSDPEEGIEGVDFVYTDTWVDMEFFKDPSKREENLARIEQMKPYQLSCSLVGDRDLRIMHDMPIHEGYEIESRLVRDPRSIIFEQAENRLHAQKGLLWWIYREAGRVMPDN